MTVSRHLPIAVCVLALTSPAFAQKVTVVPGLTAQQVLSQMSDGAAPGVGEAIALTAATEIATEPLAASSGGFIFKLDPSTGLLARTTNTFGPSFTERALTSGEGQVSIGAHFSSTSFDKIGGISLSSLPLTSIKSSGITATGDYTLSERSLDISGIVGVTDNVDVAVVVPLVSVKLAGSSSVFNAAGVNTRLAQTDGIFSGLGDVSALAKIRVFRFSGTTGITDPGGASLLVNVRLPTGSRDNLRGLGITRALVGGVFSMDRGRVHPHANVGFEYWSKQLSFSGIDGQNIKIRNQLQYAGGVEIEAAPKLTLIVDYLGQRIFGGGQIGIITASPSGVATNALSLLPSAIDKMYLAPGLKVNLKSKLLLSLNALVTMKNDGLHSKVTPVVGLILSM